VKFANSAIDRLSSYSPRPAGRAANVPFWRVGPLARSCLATLVRAFSGARQER
jgi:hypothetical protein